jgi:hypothetical protein
LLAWVEANPGPFWVRSFPFNPEVTRLAVAVRLPHRLPDFRFGTAPPGQISLDVDEAGQVRATRHAP